MSQPLRVVAIVIALGGVVTCAAVFWHVTKQEPEQTSPKDITGELEDKVRTARARATRIQELLRRPWMNHLDGVHRGRLHARAQALLSYADRASRGLDRKSEHEGLRDEGRRLLDEVSPEIERTVTALSAVESFANQAEILRRNLNQLLVSAAIPINEEFPLRNRVMQAFLPQQNALLGQLREAVENLIEKDDAVRIRMIQTNLTELIGQGDGLYRELNLILRDVDNAARRMTQIPDRLAFAGTVVARGREALARGTPPAGLDKDVLARAAAAVEAARTEHPPLAARWPKVRIGAFRDPSNPEFTDFKTRIQALLAGLNDAPRAVAAALGIEDPGAPTKGSRR